MAIKAFRTGKATILSTARAKPHAIPKQLADIPGGLYPLKMAYWETDEYRIANGWPVSVPDMDIRATTLVSAEGETLAYRDQPRGLVTGAMTRWIADDEMYDVTDLRWHPVQADQPLIWETAPDYAPTFINDYEYRQGNEVFIRDGLNFDSDSYEHMWCNLSTAIGGASGYSVIMTASMNSVYGNNLDLPYSGLWCPGYPTPAVGEAIAEAPAGGWVSLTLQGDTLYLETDQSARTKALSIANLVATTAPVMIALVIGRPYTTVYAARGPSSISRAALNVGDRSVPLDGNVVLGRSSGDILHTADMTMMDLGLYPTQLTPAQVKREFALLSGVYGGDQ